MYAAVSDIMGFSFNFGDSLQYFAITVNLTIDPFKTNVKDGIKFAETWNSWFEKKVCALKSIRFCYLDYFDLHPLDRASSCVDLCVAYIFR